MSLYSKITNGLETMKAGKQLSNPQVWSSRANVVALLVVFLQSANALAQAFGYDLKLDNVDIHTIANAIGAVGVGLVAIIHTMSNTDAGKK